MSPPPVVHASWAMMLLTVALLAPPLVFILLAKRGRDLFIRRIPGIDAIEEAIGRATELGRPIVFSTGLTGLDSLLYALLGIIGHVGRKAAAYGCRLIVPQNDYEVLPVVTETVREAFRAAGRIDAFSPQDVRFLSPEQFAFASGYMGMVHREKAASCFLFGSFAAESLVLAEAGQQVGAMQVAGTPSNNQVPFFLTSCDYTLIGEEVYAAGAYLSRSPAQLGSVRGQDAAKLVILALIVFGVVASTWLSASRGDPREGLQFTSWFARALYRTPQQKAVLAKIEVESKPEVPSEPERKPPEDELRRARDGVADSAGEAARLFRRSAAAAAPLAAWLRGSLEVLPGGEARTKGEEIAELLEESARRCRDEAETLAKLREKDLPGLAASLAALRDRRAADIARPELELLEAWVEDCPGKDWPEVARWLCAAQVAALREAVTAGGLPAGLVNHRMDAARRACHRAYFATVRRHMEGIKAAESRKTPMFMGDLEGGGVGLVLDGSKSVSGRLLPMSYSWTVDPAPGKDDRREFSGPQARVAFARSGRYRVGLKVTERPTSPRPLVLALLTNDPTSVRHETIAQNTELKLSWRVPRGVDPASAEIAWDFGDGSPRIEGQKKGEKLDGISHQYTKTGRFSMSVVVSYEREVSGAAGPSGPAGAAEEGVEPRLAALRSRLRDGLSDLGDTLSGVEEHLEAIGSGAKDYAEAPPGVKSPSEETWPDRKFMADLTESVKKLGEWQKTTLKRVGDAAVSAGRLGAAPEPASGPVKGPAATAGETGAKKLKCWNRFRIYWTVVEPREHQVSTEIEVTGAAKLPRAPWEPRPAKAAEPAEAPGPGKAPDATGGGK